MRGGRGGMSKKYALMSLGTQTLGSGDETKLFTQIFS